VTWTVTKGDCLAVMRKLPDNSIDACITDPPYGTTACKWDSVIPFEPMWAELKRVVKKDGAIVLFASQPFTSALVMSNPKMFKHEWVWIKNRGSNFVNTIREPMKEHEVVLVFSKGKWTYNKQMQERTGGGAERVKYEFTEASGTQSENYRQFFSHKRRGTSQRVPSSWQKFNTQVGLHPTQKPVDLLRYLVRTYTNEGDTVLDFTTGSGTTGVACALERRNFIGIEREKEYVTIARKRIAEASQMEVAA
jgi:site-specific DNA-methyltransferase (adenine-specific)